MSKYGRLYNSFAVNTNKLALIGWHVATQTEWSTLLNYANTHLGSSTSVVKALTSTTDWYTSSVTGAIGNNISINNSTGFSALPAGCRKGSGFSGMGTLAEWWSGICLEYNMQYDNNNYDWGFGNITSTGFSVRCIKD